ncbi:amino acid ABC transporter permease [Segeticoccus rhizosphaerae]|jgi:polar amino acid transport system permease protein|uniref:amino acid ABC transporter permease n=1 Tax=Segeticoccus rhizosphaerae TaxID=1104777 RepID=UPI0010C102D3|nr:amino acid ABC transporter permease [Ornithinicoccus soli]
MSTTTTTLPAARDASVVKLSHPTRWITAAVLLVLAAMMANALVTNQRFGWSQVGHYFFSSQILGGLKRTLFLTAVAMIIGVVLGTILAVMRMSENPVARTTAGLYIWFFRGTPLLVQLIFWYNLSALYPRLSVGIPFGPEFAGFTTNEILTVWLAAILGLGLNEAAYMCEIIRAGLLSVDQGQRSAALALGMRESLLFRRVVWPQSLRVIVPPVGNQVIGMLKFTSLVSVIALPELLYSAQLIYQQNFQTIPLLMVACIWYLLVTSVLSVAQHYIERHYGRGTNLNTGPSMAANLLAALRARARQAGDGVS